MAANTAPLMPAIDGAQAVIGNNPISIAAPGHSALPVADTVLRASRPRNPRRRELASCCQRPGPRASDPPSALARAASIASVTCCAKLSPTGRATWPIRRATPQ
ncbi:hypothetical protein [Cryobacterium sp. M15]|uniref:hypothetical protein n=1 Tax=Cryobacterium sp. M15 TaxID=2048291 RepID=UPI0035182546